MMTYKKITRRLVGQQGITLIEVLVAALILGVGMLGVISMQTQAVKYNYQGFLYTQAIFLADDIADKMRNNSATISDYETTFADSYAAVATDCEANTCTPADLAVWDKKQWKASVSRAFASGEGQIEAVPGTTNQFNIIVRFIDSRTDTDGVQAKLENHSIVVQI